MESIKNIEDKYDLKNNQVFGNFELINSEIRFLGSNNVLFCEENVKLNNSTIFFRGDNSIIYLSYTKYSDYNLIINIRTNSLFYIGKNNAMGSNFNITIEEHQNLIIGDDGLIENNVIIKTSDAFPIYDFNSKKRINYSNTVFIGDHVWLDHFTHISRGAKIGSGSIIATNSFVAPNSVIPSNTRAMGNPIKIINEKVFFTKEFTGSFKSEDTLNFSTYKSDVFMFKFVKDETLSLDRLDDIIKNLPVLEKLDFVKRLFVKNKRRNRFYI